MSSIKPRYGEKSKIMKARLSHIIKVISRLNHKKGDNKKVRCNINLKEIESYYKGEMTPRELLDEEKVKGNNYTHFANDDQPMVGVD